MRKAFKQVAMVLPICVGITATSAMEPLSENIIKEQSLSGDLERSDLQSTVNSKVEERFAHDIEIAPSNRNAKHVTTIFTVYSLEQIIKTLESSKIIIKEGKFKKDTLFAFDIDNTLLYTSSVTYDDYNAERFDAIQDIFSANNKTYGDNWMKYDDIILEQIDEQLVDKNWPAFIDLIKGRGGNVIAVTAITNKILDNGGMCVDLRAKKLKKFGIDFSNSWNLSEQWFGRKGQSAYYKNGILTTGTGGGKVVSKGQALAKLLIQKLKYKPGRIIFIDDDYKNLQSVRDFCEYYGIELIGYHYLAKNEETTMYKFPFSQTRSYLQLMHLVDKKEWLSDSLAETMLDKDGSLTKKISVLIADGRKKLQNDNANEGNINPINKVDEKECEESEKAENEKTLKINELPVSSIPDRNEIKTEIEDKKD